MPLKKNGKKWGIFAVILIAAVLLAGIWMLKNSDGPPPAGAPEKNDISSKDTLVKQDGTVQGKIVIEPIINYGDLEKNKDLNNLMDQRKEKLGIDKSLDMIVESDETFTVGKNRVAMSDIVKKAFIKEGSIFEERIEGSGQVRPETIKQYGIYVVQPGDNIWNIHFNILKEFYSNKGINVSPKADEPVTGGMSSGVGKILKFSENMVTIYNLAENKIDSDISLIDPLSKIIVYNMDEVFSLLQDINYKNIDRIQFDGKSIWIPAVK